MKILIVEDDSEICEFLSEALLTECIETDALISGLNAMKLIEENDYDLIVLDLILPEVGGEKLCRMIREKGIRTPILILSVESDVDDRVRLLNLGADDYLPKPFSMNEFLARVKALLRRPKLTSNDVLRLGNLLIDFKRHSATVGGEEVNLTNKEFLLLELLARHEGMVVSRSKIVETVWDMNADIFSNSIEVHVFNLRKKLRNYLNKDVIKTVANRGYKMELIKI